MGGWTVSQLGNARPTEYRVLAQVRDAAGLKKAEFSDTSLPCSATEGLDMEAPPGVRWSAADEVVLTRLYGRGSCPSACSQTSWSAEKPGRATLDLEVLVDNFITDEM